MNNSILSLLVVLLPIAFHASTACAADVLPEELPLAGQSRIVTFRRVAINESLPQLGARLYDKVDYELQLRKLDTEIKLTKARLAAQCERASFYDKHFGRTPALLLTRQNAHLAALESELHLKDLRKTKQLLLYHRKDRIRYRQLVLEQAGLEVRVND